MQALTFDNPLLTTYAIAAALTVLKVIGQGWITVAIMMRAHSGWAAPEDIRPGPLNPHPAPEQLAPHEGVERARRVHRNDLENIPAFWIAGFLFILTAPPLWLAQLALYGFVAARAGHFYAYATARSHELRATFYTIGTLLTAAMALYVIAVALV
ncbi:MAG: MAPEG family protein [Marivivens sp.]|nr:MAPEG family protein [Marivivens sp.]